MNHEAWRMAFHLRRKCSPQPISVSTEGSSSFWAVLAGIESGTFEILASRPLPSGQIFEITSRGSDLSPLRLQVKRASKKHQIYVIEADPISGPCSVSTEGGRATLR